MTSDGSSGSSNGSSNGSSSGSSSTHLGYFPKIAVIRETRGAEEGSVYIKREDGGEDCFSCVSKCQAYSMDYGSEALVLQEIPAEIWKAYNTIAKWIL